MAFITTSEDVYEQFIIPADEDAICDIVRSAQLDDACKVLKKELLTRAPVPYKMYANDVKRISRMPIGQLIELFAAPRVPDCVGTMVPAPAVADAAATVLASAPADAAASVPASATTPREEHTKIAQSFARIKMNYVDDLIACICSGKIYKLATRAFCAMLFFKYFEPCRMAFEAQPAARALAFAARTAMPFSDASDELRMLTSWVVNDINYGSPETAEALYDCLGIRTAAYKMFFGMRKLPEGCYASLYNLDDTTMAATLVELFSGARTNPEFAAAVCGAYEFVFGPFIIAEFYNDPNTNWFMETSRCYKYPLTTHLAHWDFNRLREETEFEYVNQISVAMKAQAYGMTLETLVDLFEDVVAHHHAGDRPDDLRTHLAYARMYYRMIHYTRGPTYCSKECDTWCKRLCLPDAMSSEEAADILARIERCVAWLRKWTEFIYINHPLMAVGPNTEHPEPDAATARKEAYARVRKNMELQIHSWHGYASSEVGNVSCVY